MRLIHRVSYLLFYFFVVVWKDPVTSTQIHGYGGRIHYSEQTDTNADIFRRHTKVFKTSDLHFNWDLVGLTKTVLRVIGYYFHTSEQ